MPVILFEGPDESGKTTFARSLHQTLSGFMDSQVIYQRSPVKEFGWQTAYGHYLADQCQINHETLLIQDRTPEISESVYGILRGEPHGRGYLYEAYNWLSQDIFMVLCTEPFEVQEEHEDADGNSLNDEDYHVIGYLYDQIYFNLRSSMLHGHPPHFRVITYNREDRNSWLNVMWQLREWLSTMFPDDEPKIRKALSYSTDSAFPMPKED